MKTESEKMVVVNAIRIVQSPSLSPARIVAIDNSQERLKPVINRGADASGAL
jgi:hypothetical protein